MGYILMIAGVVLFGVGAFILLNNKKQPTEAVQADANLPESTEAIPEPTPCVQLSPKEKGLAFENFVVDHFNKEFFTLKTWQGDKYHNGRYAEANRHPDMVVTFALSDRSFTFAVECKWRSEFKDGSLVWATEEQIGIYNKFAEEQKMDVFVAIGVGGESANPSALYIVPLKALKYPRAKEAYLNTFKREVTNAKFYYNTKEKALR